MPRHSRSSLHGRNPGQQIEPMDETTTFINVDIRLESTRDPSDLVDALGKSVYAQLFKIGRRHHAVIGLLPTPKSPTLAVLRFCRLLKRLPPRHRAIWRAAGVKEFDIGIQGGAKPQAAEWMISEKAIAGAAGVGARIRVTV